jgi:hypothetical protein
MTVHSRDGRVAAWIGNYLFGRDRAFVTRVAAVADHIAARDPRLGALVNIGLCR